MEERFASNELGVGSSPIGGSNIADCEFPIADSSVGLGSCSYSAETLLHGKYANRKSAISNRQCLAEVM